MEVKIGQCEICNIGNDDLVRLEFINRLLAEGKPFVQIISDAKNELGLEISEASLHQHCTRGHMAETCTQVQAISPDVLLELIEGTQEFIADDKLPEYRNYAFGLVGPVLYGSAWDR